MPFNGNNPESGCAFISAARRYWLSVFPAVRRELRHWQLRANEIPDPVLRRLALDAQHHKRGNIEGAAAFAAFVEPASRPLVVRALVAFQTAYDYADILSEQPSPTRAPTGTVCTRRCSLPSTPAFLTLTTTGTPFGTRTPATSTNWSTPAGLRSRLCAPTPRSPSRR